MASTYKNTVTAISAQPDLGTFTHVDYKYYSEDWRMIRDALSGERRIKEQGATYLPALDVEYGTTYDAFKARAVYVNMTARTVMGLVGTIFRRPLKAFNVKKEDLANVTLSGLDLNLFAKKLALEVASIGRIGVLVDMDNASNKVYMTEYIAENILGWKTATVNGREVLTYVLLREIVDDTPALDGTFVAKPTTAYAYNAQASLGARYRVLLIEDGVYKQRVYSKTDERGNPLLTNSAYDEIIPTKNGVPFSFIPMKIIGPMSPTPEVQRSPIIDIVTINVAHYRTSAMLEHGRYFTALPIYYVPVTAGQEKGDYYIGPSVVWEVMQGEKPGILEYYGTGLKSLADSLTEKEEHISQLGGRVMGIRPQATAESDNIFKLKQANEMSILLNITESLSAGLTELLTWFLDWQRKPTTDIRILLNQDFKALQIAARELRAISLLYQQGILPIAEVHRILQEAEFISDEVSLEEFKAQLDNLKNFPHQPDVEAMHEGYPNAQARLDAEKTERQLNADTSQAEMDRQHQALIEKRKLDQQFDIGDVMFEQSKQTMQFQTEQDKKLASHQTELDIKKAKAAPKPAPAAKKPTAPAKKPAKK